MEIDTTYTAIKSVKIKFGQSEIEDALLADAFRLNRGLFPNSWLIKAKRVLDWEDSDDGVLTITLTLTAPEIDKL